MNSLVIVILVIAVIFVFFISLYNSLVAKQNQVKSVEAGIDAQLKRRYEVLAYPELGPEAVARLTVEDFPAIVAIDCEGNNFYEVGQAPYKKI